MASGYGAKEHSLPDWFCEQGLPGPVLLNHPSTGLVSLLFILEMLTVRGGLEYLAMTPYPVLPLLGSATQQIEESPLISVGSRLSLTPFFIPFFTMVYNPYAQTLTFCSWYIKGSLGFTFKNCLLQQGLNFDAIISQRTQKNLLLDSNLNNGIFDLGNIYLLFCYNKTLDLAWIAKGQKWNGGKSGLLWVESH